MKDKKNQEKELEKRVDECFFGRTEYCQVETLNKTLEYCKNCEFYESKYNLRWYNDRI